MSGWIKLHRQLQDNPLWTAEPFTRGQAWVDLLMIASPVAFHVRFADELITMPIGTIRIGESAMANRWMWKEKRVRRFMASSEIESHLMAFHHKGSILYSFKDVSFIGPIDDPSSTVSSEYFRATRSKSKTQHLRLGSAKWSALRRRVIDRDNGVCQYCGSIPDQIHVDHIVPLAKGGTNKETNLATSCVDCNLSKGAKLISEWRAS